jgi:hypothetical protein
MSDDDDSLAAGAQEVESASAGLELDLQALSSVALARLVEEVKNADFPSAPGYDRTYNRHNR